MSYTQQGPSLNNIMFTMMQVLCTAFLGAAIAILVTRRKSRHSPSGLPRLPGSGWITGDFSKFINVENVGDADSELVDQYGLAFWMKGTLNRDNLYLADPKGIQHVLNTGGYTFHKALFLLRLITGPSLIAVEGETHARQRKIMNPGFSHKALQDFVPFFSSTAKKGAGRWKDIVTEDRALSPVIDVYTWLSRITLDAVGQAAFSHDFGAIDETEDDFMKAYRNVFVNAFHKPNVLTIVIVNLLGSLPIWMAPYLRKLPLRGFKKLSELRGAAGKVAHGIVEREARPLETGKPSGKDIMSILVRANRSESPKSRLSDEEMMAQLTAIIFAGHDTTAASLVWTFYELSRHPEVQVKLRDEIKETRTAAAAAGREELSIVDFESMEYTIAVIKETLRFYPIAAHSIRQAGRDEIIPLSKPYRNASGEEITSVPVKNGQTIFMSFWSYNRIKDLWGEDATEWNPERFVKDGPSNRAKFNIGVYANLATFSSGVHSCIGWRFAVLEMQAVLIALIEDFHFSPPPAEHNISIIRGAAPTLVPIVKGQDKRGAQMPLRISAVN